MPLKDRNKSATGIRIPRLGKIRLGHKEGNRPVQDEFFVLRDAPEVAEFYGPEPTELDVILPFKDFDQNFDAWYKIWTSGGIAVCKGDGEFVQFATPMRVETKAGRDGKEHTAVYNAEGEPLVDGGVAQRSFSWNGSKFEDGDTVPCGGPDGCLYPQCAACSISGVLRVMMSDPALFRLGYYQIATKSKNNHDSIRDVLRLVSGDGALPVSGIKFKLRLVKRATMYWQDGKRHGTEKWFLELEPEPDLMRRLYVQRGQMLIGGTAPVAAIPETVGEYDDPEDDAPPPWAEAGGPAGDWDPDVFEAGDDGGWMGDEPVNGNRHEPDDWDTMDGKALAEAWSVLWKDAKNAKVEIPAIYGGIPEDEWRDKCREAARMIRGAQG